MSIITRIKDTYKVALHGLPKKPPIFRPYVKDIKVGDAQFKFLVTDEESNAWYVKGNQHEGLEVKMLLHHIKPHFHILEIGVHNGFYTAFFTSLLQKEQGKYIGIELMPGCYAAILAQMKLNEAGANFQVLNAAAGNENGLTAYADVATGNGTVKSDQQGVKIPMVKADSLLEAFDNTIDLIKIDVEGFETFVLKGAEALLAKAPHLQLEIHPSQLGRYGNNIKQVLDMIDWSRYESYYFCNPNSNLALKLDAVSEWRSFNPNNPPEVDNFNLFLISKTKKNN